MNCYATEIRDGDDIREIIRLRKAELQLSDALLEQYAGLSAGHISKILPLNPRKQMSLGTLSLLLGGVGLRLLAIEDPEATRRILNRTDYEPRREQYIQPRKQIEKANV